ncbi:MAG: hypothetical protein BWY10_00837 [Chloroflexi bacterium ADurb.Bin180]|nr:MAG: hypothetical protein BWY10_00837 [Chloroflexi bacterium ADurb.Bin180]
MHRDSLCRHGSADRLCLRWRSGAWHIARQTLERLEADAPPTE